MVASFDTGDALSDALHNACSLVPQDAGEQALRVCTHTRYSEMPAESTPQPAADPVSWSLSSHHNFQ